MHQQPQQQQGGQNQSLKAQFDQQIQMSARGDQVFYANALDQANTKKAYLNNPHGVEPEFNPKDPPKARKISLFTQYKSFIGNGIQTSKYYGMPWFIFQNIWFQMHKLANIYFVIIAVLQSIPSISISNGQPVILLPLLVVITVSMIKDYFEDLKRKKADAEENNRQVCVLVSSALERKMVPSKELKVGHVVLISKNDLISADLLVLEIAEKKKECYVETKNLDGETNLKIKEIPESLRVDSSYWQDPTATTEIECIPPNRYLEDFHGSMQVKRNGIVQTDFLDSKHLLLRGCTLRTTPWVKGLVLYTGNDSKIMMNSSPSAQKFSSLEVMMNKFILVIFALQVLLCFTSGLYGAIWTQAHKTILPYLRLGALSKSAFSFVDVVQITGTWVLIFTNFIPISLIVTLEVVKYIQGQKLEKDSHYYNECRVQSSNLNEELGQIKYVFSDKTGTLTQNSMKFKCISIGGHSFGDIKPAERSQHYLQSHLQNACVSFYDPQFANILASSDSPAKTRIMLVLRHMGLCHSVVPQGATQYSGPSPDEICLVSFAQSQGVQFLMKNEENIMLLGFKIGGSTQQQEQYKLLHTLEFNSDRKRMSVIIQRVNPNGQLGEYLLLTKGADNVMERRLAGVARYDQETSRDINKYSELGYRTLVLTTKIIPPNEIAAFEKELSAARMLQAGRDQAIDALYDQIEQGLEFLAVTGVDDELQVDVALTIERIKAARIYFWVLTGDKEETAISIGHSTKVLGDESTTRQILLSKIIRQVEQGRQLTQPNHKIGMNKSEVLKEAVTQASQMLLGYIKEGLQEKGIKIALIVKGDDLITIQQEASLEKSFVKMAILCDTVIASRVSPAQKAMMVDLVRRELPDVSTLAIGDGANDVSMINAAHVGIGIRGKEGTQAERASNYAVPEFKYLGRLLFDFGRESYRKNSQLVLYNFYKNLLLVLPQWWFGFMNGFSGVALYDPWLYQLYNTCYTALPIILFAIDDRQHSLKKLMTYPLDFYQQGPQNKLFDYRAFGINFLKGLVDSAIVVFICFFALENISSGPRASQEYYLYATGMVSYGASILISNFRVFTVSHSLSPMHLACVIGSYLFYVVSYAMYDAILKQPDVHNTFLMQFTSIRFYFVNIALIAATSLIDLAIYVFKVNENDLIVSNSRQQQQQALQGTIHIDSSRRVANGLMNNTSQVDSNSNLFTKNQQLNNQNAQLSARNTFGGQDISNQPSARVSFR